MSLLQMPDDAVSTAEVKPETAPETTLEVKPEVKSESKPEAEPEKVSPEKKSSDAPEAGAKAKEKTDISEYVAEFCGGARLKIVARRTVLISEGKLRRGWEPIIDEQLPDDADVYIAPPVFPVDYDEAETETEADLVESDEEENEENEEDKLPVLPDYFDGENEPCDDPLGIEDRTLEERLRSYRVQRDWIKEYFNKCRKFARKPFEKDGDYLMRLARKFCPYLEINFVRGTVEDSSKEIDPDALPALLLASASALLGAEKPTVNIYFRNKFDEPRITILLSTENGKADTVFFNGIRHYADNANIYFVTVPYLRGAFVEMCVKRVEPGAFGLKSPVAFGLPPRS